MELQSRQIRRLRADRAARFAALMVLLLLAPLALHAAPGFEPPGFEATERVTVKSAIDGDTVELEDGRRVRLVGLDVPLAPASLGATASAALAELVGGRAAILGLAGRRTDRYGRVLAQLYRDDGLWLQGELLTRGLARVESQADNRALVPVMLAWEGEARAARRGLWALSAYAVLAPEDARRHLDRFALVEGTVTEVTQSSSRAELHFGATARDGFTALLSPESRRLLVKSGILAKAGLALESLAGRRLRVRGYVRWWNGAVIDVTHPEQIELLGP